MFSLSREFLRCVLTPRGLMGARSAGYWWGHDPVSEKELAERAEKTSVVKWQQKGTSLDKAKQFTYDPAVIEKESDMGNEINQERMNMVDTHQWLQQPVPYIHALTHEGYFTRKELIDSYKALVDSQRFVRERVITLGPDLAAAYFLIYRNCRVRFKGHDHWTEIGKDGKIPELPTSYEPGYYVEGIDASESNLVYEGIHNMRNLIYLNYLDLSYCRYIDAWCLDRITGEYKDSLEYIDLSGCISLDWNGLEVLWRLSNLKTLVLYDMEHVKDLSLICLMLLDIFPNLDIKGVDYINPKLLEGTEHEHLIQEIDELELLASGEKIGEAIKSDIDKDKKN